MVEFSAMPDAKRYDEFGNLIRLHTGQILAYIDALLLNRNDAEDLFQETCLVLWQKFDDFVPDTNFLAWALRTADYKVMNFRTMQSRRFAFTADLRDALIVEVSNRSSEQEQANVTVLSGCMDGLSQSDQRLVKLCYAEGVPIRQLADAFGRSPKSVQNSLYRIRSWLLNCIRRELNKADTPAYLHDHILKEEDRP